MNNFTLLLFAVVMAVAIWSTADAGPPRPGSCPPGYDTVTSGVQCNDHGCTRSLTCLKTVKEECPKTKPCPTCKTCDDKVKTIYKDRVVEKKVCCGNPYTSAYNYAQGFTLPDAPLVLGGYVTKGEDRVFFAPATAPLFCGLKFQDQNRFLWLGWASETPVRYNLEVAGELVFACVPDPTMFEEGAWVASYSKLWTVPYNAEKHAGSVTPADFLQVCPIDANVETVIEYPLASQLLDI